MQKLLLCLFVFIYHFPYHTSKDADCFAQKDPTDDNVCTSVDTGTYSICCFATYSFSNGTKINQCLTIDGTNPQNTFESIETAIDKMPQGSINRDINCGTESEKCYDIQSPTSFKSCNITEQIYPFSCCYVETEQGKYCYPLNARYQNNIDNYTITLKQSKNLTQNPKIVCSNKPLPVWKGSSYVLLNKVFLISVILVIFYY